MIEWTIAILFTISAILLVLSLFRTYQTSKAEEKRIDMAHIALLKEMKEMKEAIHHLELENEIVINEAGLKLSLQEKRFKREVLDLYKRGYSIESIAEKSQVSDEEIIEILAPFVESGNEGRKVAK